MLRELAVSYGQAGDFLGSPIHVNLGDFQGALKYFRQEAKIVEDLSRSDPSDQRARYDTGMAWMRIGVTLQSKGDLVESNRALARSMAEFGSMQGGVPDQMPYQRALELVYEYKGRNSSMLGDRRGAMEWYGKSLALAGEQLRKDPRDMPAKRQSVESGGRLAVLLALQGDVTGAQQLIERVLKAAEGTPAGWHGLAWKFQAQIYQTEGNCPAAAQAFQKAISIWVSEPAAAKGPQYPAELREAKSGLRQCSSKASN